MDLIQALANWYVAAYVVLVVVIQLAVAGWLFAKKKRVERRRKKVGLPEGTLVDRTQSLGELRRESLLQSATLLLSVVFLPMALVALSTSGGIETDAEEPGLGLAMAFLLFLGGIAFNATDVAKAFLGGLAFRTATAFTGSMQVGDRVTLGGHSGKVLDIGVLNVKLGTADDDLVSIPTASLWSEAIVSANAGARPSLSVMTFYLAPWASETHRQGAEDAIWNAIQGSTYFDPSLPMQIYLSQERDAIALTAKAYVASTYNEPLFKSDVTRAFLNHADKAGIPLAQADPSDSSQSDASE